MDSSFNHYLNLQTRWDGPSYVNLTARRSIAEIPPLRDPLSQKPAATRDAVADAPKPLASFAIVARATAAEWRRGEITEIYIIFICPVNSWTNEKQSASGGSMIANQ